MFFMIIWGETRIEFTQDAAGAVTRFQLRQGGQIHTAKRVAGA
jgi:hypothetical protein